MPLNDEDAAAANDEHDEHLGEPDGLVRGTGDSSNSHHHHSRSVSPSLPRPLAAAVTTAVRRGVAVVRTRRKRKGMPTNKQMYSAALHSLSSSGSEDEEENDEYTERSHMHPMDTPSAATTTTTSHPFPSVRHRRTTSHDGSEEDTVTGNWSIEDDEDDVDDGATIASSTSSLERNERRRPRSTTSGEIRSTPSSTDEQQHQQQQQHSILNATDLALCRALDAEYERAVEERHIHWTARYQSVRQSTVVSVVCMLLLMGTGTAFYHKQAGGYWTIPEALLFSIYTITTVGYGHLDVPDTPLFQLYTVVFIFLGIAMLTILVAQVYQCIALEASRVANGSGLTGNGSSHHHRSSYRNSSSSGGRRGGPPQRGTSRRHTTTTTNQQYYGASATSSSSADCRSFVRTMDTWRNRLRETEVGRAVAVVLPFATLVVVGAVVIGLLEGWSMTEALYFACVSLTTVGFGDYYPTRTVSIWFCCLWLPFSVGFMSLYFAETAAFYMRLSDRNIQRIERVLRRRMQRAKERVARERATILRRALRGQQHAEQSKQQQRHDDDEEAAPEMHHPAASNPTTPPTRKQSLSDDGSEEIVPPQDATPRVSNAHVSSSHQHHRLGTSSSHSQQKHQQRHLFGTTGFEHSNRRARIQQNARQRTSGSTGTTTMMATMKDVLATVHSTRSSSFRLTDPGAAFLRVAARPVLHQNGTVRRQPTFALRALVQERIAGIIATDIAGYQSSIEIKEYTLSVTIQSLQHTANKWHVPRRARKAFRAVAFEALYCVGEHALIVQGADALLALTPFAFHQIFSPLLAAFGDADTMEGWLDQTQALADVDLVVGEDTAGDDDVMLPPENKDTQRAVPRLVVPSLTRRGAANGLEEDGDRIDRDDTDTHLKGECELPDIT